MSRYLLLFILVLPFALAGLLTTITQYKLRRITHLRLIVQTLLWVFILTAIAIAEPTYNYLFHSNLTQSDSLSLFDVVQITGIIIVFYMANRLRAKVEVLERRMQDLHQELSIILSTKEK
jgi:hypothetical protein